MKKMVLAFYFIASFLVLTGCSSPMQEVEQAEKIKQEYKVARMTIVSSAKPVDVLPAFKSFTWHKDYSYVLSAINNDSENDIKEYIRNEIIRYLKTKGYVYQPNSAQADLVIGFLFALEDDLADQKIQDRFGLLPGVSASGVTDKRYSKGSLLLAAIDIKLGKIYWRSAMQGFVDFEKDKHDDTADKMQAVLDLMLGGFPKAGQ